MKNSLFLIFSLLLLFQFSCEVDNSQDRLEKSENLESAVIEDIIANPDFRLAFNKFLKDQPATRKVQRIEFWLDTVIDRTSISSTDLNALHKKAGERLERHNKKFMRKQFLIDSLFQDRVANNGEITEEVAAQWESELNGLLEITADDLAKQADHREYTQSLAATVQEEIAARERLLQQYPQLQDERFVARVIEYHYNSLEG